MCGGRHCCSEAATNESCSICEYGSGACSTQSQVGGNCSSSAGCYNGKAVQVEPMKPVLLVPGIERIKLIYDELLSRFAFDVNLRLYTVERRA